MTAARRSLTREERHRMFAALGNMPVLALREGRDLLLADLPDSLIASLPRSETRIIDLTKIVDAAEAWGRLNNGSLALHILIENACNLSVGSNAGVELAALLQELRQPMESGSTASAPIHSLQEATGADYNRLRDALLAAFPSRGDLAAMVRYGLDTRLDAIVEDGPLQAVIFNLIEWALAHSKLPILVIAALKANPENESLHKWAATFGLITRPGKDSD